MENQKEKKVYKVKVLREVCIGATTCVVLAPDAFEMDSDNIAIVKEEAQGVDDSTLLMAAQSCPVAAILLYDSEGKQIFPPLN